MLRCDVFYRIATMRPAHGPLEWTQQVGAIGGISLLLCQYEPLPNRTIRVSREADIGKSATDDRFWHQKRTCCQAWVVAQFEISPKYLVGDCK
jgi:hypothetical protein